MKNITQGFAKSILLVAMSSVVFTSCGKTDIAAQVSAPAVGGATSGLPSGGNDYAGGDSNHQYDDMLPVEQSPDQPLDTPEPLPAPQTPVEPGQTFAVKAVGNTTSFAVPRLSKYIQLNGVYVYIHLTWQPVNGAAEYWIYKNTIPEWNEVRRENAFATVEAKDSRGLNSGLAGYKDGLAAPNLKDGNLWDRIKRGFQSVTLRPNVDYVYKIVAVDANGIPMSQSEVTTGSAMGAVAAPQMLEALNTNTVNPKLPWKRSNDGGLPPHGYYVSLFPSVQGITRGVLPSTSLAVWGTYRDSGYKSNYDVVYGKHKSNLLSYAGALPFDITFDLKPGAKYSWSVVSIRTNANNIANATQISRSWGGFGHLQVSPNARPANPNTEADLVSQRLRSQRVNQQRAPYPTYNRQTVPQNRYPAQNYNQNYNQYPAQNNYGGYPAQNYSQYPAQNNYGGGYPAQGYNQYPQQQRRRYN